MPNSVYTDEFDDIYLALGTSSVLTDEENGIINFVDFLEIAYSDQVFPKDRHKDPDDVIPDWLIPWLKRDKDRK